MISRVIGNPKSKFFRNYENIISGTSSPIIGSVYTLINTIAPYLSANIDSLKNSDFFTYSLDGSSYFITDGGNDMFDGGNYTAPWFTANTNYTNGTTIITSNSINYATTTASIIDTDFYYASLGYSTTKRPLSAIGTRSVSDKPIGFQKAGNIGADGSGFLNSEFIYNGNNVNGFTCYAMFRQTYGQGADPAICDLYILLGHSNWGSVFGTVSSIINTNKGIQGGALYCNGIGNKDILAITTLLSRPTPSGITFSYIKDVVDSYILKIKEVLSY